MRRFGPMPRTHLEAVLHPEWTCYFSCRASRPAPDIDLVFHGIRTEWAWVGLHKQLTAAAVELPGTGGSR